jgi:hypothetical protein
MSKNGPQKNTLRRGKNLISPAFSQLDVSRHVRPPASFLNRVSNITRAFCGELRASLRVQVEFTPKMSQSSRMA